MSLWTRLRNVFRPEALNQELDAEIQTHLEEMREMGVDPRQYGNPLRYREESRDIKSLPALESLRSDFIFGWRQLAKKKTASAIAVISLTLGIGATTSVLRLLEAAFLRPLAIRDAERLHFLRYTMVNIDGKESARDSFTYLDLRLLREAVKDDAALLMVSFADRQDITYGNTSDTEKISRQYVNGSLFEDFALRPAAGRLFGSAEDSVSADHRVAVISYPYWERRFGLDPNIVGKTFRYEDADYTIIGVVEPSFTGTSTGAFTDIFLPLLANRRATTGLDASQWSFARILVHLKPHATPAATRDRLSTAFTNYRAEAIKASPAGTPQAFLDAYGNARLQLLPASHGVSNFHRDYFAPLSILAATAVLVLLLSCAGVANLLAAQSAARSREIALRISIGAGRIRLIQLLLVESLMLAAAAAGLGLLFSWLATPWVVSNLNPPDNPVRLHLAMDGRVLLLGAALTFAVTLLFGLLPALQASSLNPIEAIKGAMNHPGRLRLMRSLAGAQITFCFLVCFVASLTAASLQRLDQQPLGFTPERLLLVDLETRDWDAAPQSQSLGKGPVEAKAETWRQLLARAAQQPGVSEASLSNYSLQAGGANIGDIQVGSRPVEIAGPYVLRVSPEWFATMKIALREGRGFRENEAEPVAIVNEQFGRRYFQGRSAYGERIIVEKRPCRIIGVTSDIRLRDLREAIRPTVYFPLGSSRYGTLILRLAGNVSEAALAKPLRQWIGQEFPQFRVLLVRPQMDLIHLQTIRERLLAALSSFFGVVALILAGMGLYAVLSYNVAQRGREIAIRMALGARATTVAGRIVLENAGLLAIGALTGLFIGLGAKRLIQPILFEVSDASPEAIGAATLALLASCALAAAVPLARAIRTDPARTLRSE